MRRRIAAVLALAALALPVLAGDAGAAPASWPEVIPLPDGYRPEGVASAGGTSVYVGSIPTGAVSLVDVRTGSVHPLVPAREGRAAIGLEEAGGLLFVAGGPTGKAFVYDARTGGDVAEVALTAAGSNTFVNDVVVSHGTAWFTDSRSLTLWAVDTTKFEATPLPLTGIELTPGNNLNGIEAGPGGQVLYAIQSSTGTLFEIDPTTGVATARLGGLTNGDGLLRHDQELFVVQNRSNQVAVVDLRTFSVVDVLTSPAFAVPTTVARVGNQLVLPNAKFGLANPGNDFEVVSLRR
jgi:sugar lactone lactonase YvrE